MKNSLILKILSFILVLSIATTAICSGALFVDCTEAYAYTTQIGSIKGSSVNVRSGPGTNYSKVASLGVGAQVYVYDEVAGSDGQTWCKVTYNNDTKEGYVAKAYVSMATSTSGLSDSQFEQMLTNQNFPDSYKPYLRALHKEYPNWTFTSVQTGLDWETAVTEESVVGRNLVYKDAKSSWKSTESGAFDWDNNYWPGFDGASWQAASKDIIAYYMDPRNFMDSTYIFQFLDQKYNSGLHTADGLSSMLKGTFMESSYTGTLGGSTTTTTTTGTTTYSGYVSDSKVQLISPAQALELAASAKTSTATSPGSSSTTSTSTSAGPGATGPGVATTDASGATYVDMLMQAAQESGVNPYVLASMIIQEQGKTGSSQSISGTYSSYPGIYNYYNVEAYASGNMSAVERGLWWASQTGTYSRPWNTRLKAIVGGATFYGEGYVNKNQNTFYLKKFNVANSSNRYKHQYMTNVQAAASEGYNLAQAYTSEVRTAAHNFEIPVYSNMPASTTLPTGDGNPNNKLSNLYVDGFSLTPTFNKDTLSYDLIVDPSVTTVNVVANAIAGTSTVSGTGAFNLQTGVNAINVTVTAQNSDVRTYTINVVRQNGAQTGGAVNTVPGTQTGPGVSSSVSTGTTQTISNVSSDNHVTLIGPGGQ